MEKTWLVLALFFCIVADTVARVPHGQVVQKGENVTLPIPGNTEDGCKFILQALDSNLTCCYSADTRGETMCDPRIQSPECREGKEFEVEEEVVDDQRLTSGCGLRMLDIQPDDEGQYLVIFPARHADNIRIQLEVGVKKPAGEVQQFRQGENVILSTPGDTQDGCKFVFQDPYTDTTCCYSARSRKDTLCDPSIQSSGCRKRPAFRVVEEVVDDHRVTVGCGLRMLDIQPKDEGKYLVIFPASLADNIEIQMEVKEKPSGTGSSMVVISIILGMLCSVVAVVIYKKMKQANAAILASEDPDPDWLAGEPESRREKFE